MSILESFIGHRKQKRDSQETPATRYHALVKRFAAGEEIDLNEADAIVEAAGKSEADLQTDVEKFNERVAKRAMLDAGVGADEEMASADEERKAAEWELLSAQRELSAKIDAARMRVARAKTQAAQATHAKAFLMRTVTDPALLRELADMNHRRTEIGGKISELQHELRPLEVAAEAAETRLKRERSKFSNPLLAWQRADAKKRISLLESSVDWTRLERLQSELGDLKEEMAVLDKQAAEIELRMLEP
ncbi:MAG: hypothetical protein NXI32_14480 [bacterium]|nr:hypothetical protein [bacterium]